MMSKKNAVGSHTLSESCSPGLNDRPCTFFDNYAMLRQTIRPKEATGMTSEQMRFFLEAARLLNFTAAAVALYTTPPPCPGRS